MKKINILIADDHPAFREGLSQLLKDEADLKVIAVAGDGEEAVEYAAKSCPDVAIVDVAMPRSNGLEAAERIRRVSPATAVLMLSAFSYKAYILGALRAGAMGYLPKDTPLNKLISAIRMVHAGGEVFNLKAIHQILYRSSSGRTSEKQYSGGLHPREVQVLKAVARGATNQEIADQLGIKVRTVESHIVNIFNKLGINSRTGAVLCALKEGWISPDDLINEGNESL